MASKLTWHFQSVPGWAASVVNAEWVKVMDPPHDNPFPACKVIGRVYVPDSEANAMVARGSQGAREWYGRCMDAYLRAPWVYAWEAPNEPPVSTLQQRTSLTAFTQEWVGLMHQANRKTVALCLGVGWPDVGQAPDLARALGATDYWALHEYAAPTMRSRESWLCLRYRRTVAELQAVNARIPPLFITECGIDGGTASQPGKGWKTYTDRAGYMNQLVWYDSELQKDPYVKAATVFTSGPNGDWVDFDFDQVLSNMLRYHIHGQPETDLRTLLLEVAEAHQVLQFNPAASLQKVIFRDGYCPNSPEFTIIHDNTTYVAQRAEHVGTGDVRIYYAKMDDWGNVQFVAR